MALQMMLRTITRRFATAQGRRNLRYALSRRMLTPVATKLGFTVLADHYYHPIPNPDALRRQQHRGHLHCAIAWDLPHQLATTTRLLRTYGSEFNDPKTLGWFGYDEAVSGVKSGDAELLYAMVRDQRPARVIEMGTGGSTLVMAAALRKNALDTGRRCQLLSIDPDPPETIPALNASAAPFFDHQLLREPAQQGGLARYRQLGSGDLLFVDSSHAFKPGSDVEFQFLQLYPALPPGVLIHIHDIFAPQDYPLTWNLDEHRYWNELYFLEVFLACNNRFRVEACLSMVHDASPSLLTESIDAFHRSRQPGSFWMRSLDPSPTCVDA